MGRNSAVVCQNGHVISEAIGYSSRDEDNFCETCGAKAVRSCEECDASIPGQFEAVYAEYIPPSFCSACGKSYPWTAQRLQAATELANEMEELSVEDRAALQATFPDLIADTPRTEVAASRFRRIMSKAAKETGTTMRGVLTSVLTEAAKRLIYGG